MSDAEHKPLITVVQMPIGGVTVQAVDARELHDFLEVKRDFTNWAKGQITRARLVNGRDYSVIQREGINAKNGVKSAMGRPVSDYWLTLDAAKHIGMMAGTEKGFQVREYFIECERRAATALPQSRGVQAFEDAVAVWHSLPPEERRERRQDAYIYLRAYGPTAFRRYIKAAGYAEPLSEWLPSPLQREFDLRSAAQDQPTPDQATISAGTVTITVTPGQQNGSAH